MTRSEREARRRKYRRRRQLLAVGLLLLLILLVFAVVCLVQVITGAAGEQSLLASSTTTSSTESTTKVTTTYPTLASGSVSGLESVQAAVLYDVTNDTLIYSKNANQRLYPASLTKMLTAVVACRYLSESDNYTVGSEIELAEWDASKAYLTEGTTISFRQLLEALLMRSGADAAYCLAAHTGRAVGGESLSDSAAVALFIDLMNQTAQSLGCTNSHFVTPDGYHDPDHYTTPADMLLIAQEARSIPILKTVMAQSTGQYYYNTNQILDSDSSYYYTYADGLKTGYTDEAGFCLASSATRYGVTLISIVMFCDSPDTYYAATAALFESGFALSDTMTTYATAGQPSTTTTYSPAIS